MHLLNAVKWLLSIWGLAALYLRTTFSGFFCPPTAKLLLLSPPSLLPPWVPALNENFVGHKMKFARTISYEPSCSKNVNP